MQKVIFTFAENTECQIMELVISVAELLFE